MKNSSGEQRVWKVIGEVRDGWEGSKEYANVGICGMDFRKPKGRPFYLRLVQHLWPGNWHKQIQQMNDAIMKENRRKVSPCNC